MMAQSQMAALVEPEAAAKASEVRIFLFGVGRDKLEAAAAESGIA